MINGTIIGDRELVRRLRVLPASARADVNKTVQALGFELEARVKTRKLTGQVLGVRTGRLRASISQATAQQRGDSRSRFEATADKAVYYVGTNVKYGAAWEYGARATTILPVKAKALHFFVGGNEIFAARVNKPAQKARPFLVPALNEMRTHITDRLTASLRGAMVKALA